MKMLTKQDAKGQRAGGMAALYLALAYLVAMPYFLLVANYEGATTGAEKLAVIVSNYGGMYAMYLITYVFFGVVLGALALALYDRLRVHAPATARIATAVGLLWSFALVTSGMVWNYGMTTAVALAKTDPTQAQVVWQSLEPVADALGGAGGEFLGGLWVLLVSVVALRSGALSKALGWLGIIVGVTGLTSVVPPLHDAAYAFGLLQIVWFVWVGVSLLRIRATAAETSSSREPALLSATREPDLAYGASGTR
ncbi:MAG: hypothetical protein CVT66_09480 [Actinobacteria bacterium HGW-Actinobacteria-6]|jgi:hypothetical protein|nr:MAG: hypothetical protein CVT66_09480 [Actinobacteria bacterium HGW-Actinobacteria-6]